METEWKSPRAVEVEIRDYKRERFEYYMTKVDEKTMPQTLAFMALREEMAYVDLEEHGAESRI